MREPTKIIITDHDWVRLERLLSQVSKTANNEWLQAELDRAQVVPSEMVPADVVTMNSKVQYLDESSGQLTDVTVVYPNDADVNSGRISILAPVGSALLGLSVGQRIEWKMPAGNSKTLLVCRVLYQPEHDTETEPLPLVGQNRK